MPSHSRIPTTAGFPGIWTGLRERYSAEFAKVNLRSLVTHLQICALCRFEALTARNDSSSDQILERLTDRRGIASRITRAPSLGHGMIGRASPNSFIMPLPSRALPEEESARPVRSPRMVLRVTRTPPTDSNYRSDSTEPLSCFNNHKFTIRYRV